MNKKFFLLDSVERGLKFGVFLEKTEFGTIGIVNCHFNLDIDYEILISDKMGENFYAKITENPFSFSLPSEFVVDDEIIVDIFLEDQLIASSADSTDEFYENTKPNTGVDEWLDETSKNYPKDYFSEAREFINKAKELYSKPTEESFFNKIGSDFNLLYSVGEEDYLLKKKFKNSEWRKVNIEGQIYILGKIYAGKTVIKDEDPSFVAIAVPTTMENAKKDEPLGKFAKFYNANIYDSFGFLVLVQNAITGKAVSL